MVQARVDGHLDKILKLERERSRWTPKTKSTEHDRLNARWQEGRS